MRLPVALIVLCAAVLMIFRSQLANTAVEAEQPRSITRQCVLPRGAWCLLNNAFEIVIEREADSGWSLLVSEPHWADEPGVIIESAGCESAKADMLRATRTEDVVWHGSSWRQVVVELTANGSCTIKLRVPLVSEAKLDMATSALSTHIAACFKDQPCEERIVAAEVYPLFK